LGHPVNEYSSAFQFNSLGFPIVAAKHVIATLSQQVLARQRVDLTVPIRFDPGVGQQVTVKSRRTHRQEEK
jgi:hypothetical protein